MSPRLSTTSGGLVAGIEVTIWATAKAVLMGAETAHWFRKEQKLEAFKHMARDARALIPIGMEMTAACNLLVESQDDLSGESLTRLRPGPRGRGDDIGMSLKIIATRKLKHPLIFSTT